MTEKEKAKATTELLGLPGSEPKPDFEIIDVPPPIIYDDRWGKTKLNFYRTTKRGRPYLGIRYDSDGQERDLSELCGPGFMFFQSRNGFSAMSNTGERLIFFNWEILAQARQNLLFLGHEMGHSIQGDSDKQLWEIVVKRDYKALKGIPTPFVQAIKEMSDQMPDTRRSQVQRFMHGYEHDSPIGFTSLPGFINPALSYKEVYDITHPFDEIFAWQYAFRLQNTNKLNCGFEKVSQMVNLAWPLLVTYRNKFNNPLYLELPQ